MQNPSEPRGAARKRVVEVALEKFYERGINGASLKDVTATAAVACPWQKWRNAGWRF